MDPDKVVGPNLGYIWSASSFCIFLCNCYFLEKVIPDSAKTGPDKRWKWRNTANSLLHSIITGIWSCICFWQSPEMRADLISKYTPSSHGVMAVSFGYFMYDLLDMMINHRKRSSYELAVHHVLVLLCFGLAVATRYYLGYGLLALFVEVNSIFLHIRQLMILQNVSKSNVLYRINSSFNLGTFIIFRIMTLGWMTHWLVSHRSELTSTAFFLGFVSLPVLMVMNIILFMRVVYSDFFKKPPLRLLSEKSEEVNENGTSKTD